MFANSAWQASERKESSDGFELSFATQTLVGTFVLARMLLPALKLGQPSKVIIVSSGGMYTGASYMLVHPFVFPLARGVWNAPPLCFPLARGWWNAETLLYMNFEYTGTTP